MSAEGAKPHVVAFVPARMASSRFPGKPLVEIAGLPMVEHVRRRSALSESVDEVVVATCDQEIADVVASYGGRSVMTADTHLDCVDRIGEAIGLAPADVAIIVQGDEPLIRPQLIDAVAQGLLAVSDSGCACVLSTISNPDDMTNSDVVKAVVSNDDRLLYLTRAGVPFERRPGVVRPLRQTGLSAFRRETLMRYVELDPSPLELAEGVGFLRMLQNGMSVHGIIVEEQTFGVDRLGDVAIIEAVLEEDAEQRALFGQISP